MDDSANGLGEPGPSPKLWKAEASDAVGRDYYEQGAQPGQG
jgi:hypothetical protein